MMAMEEEAAVSTPQTSCSSRSLRPKQTLQVLTGAQRRGLKQLAPMPSPCPTQDMVDDTYIRNINDLSLQLKNRDPEQVRTICQRRHHLNNRRVPEPEMVGQDRGLEGYLRLSLAPSLLGGTVSMATCFATSGDLKRPWRYTHCLSSWILSQSRLGRR